MPACLIGMEACVGAHHLSRQLKALGHDARLMPARYVRPYSKGPKNDFRDAEAIAEAVLRPTMKFVDTKRPQSWEKHGLKSWIEAAARRLNRFKLAIALANKLARIVWGVLHDDRNFEVRPLKPARQAA
jgi:transposase